MFNFVLDCTSKELDNFKSINVDRDWNKFKTGIEVWTVQSYLLLKGVGLDVELNNQYLNDKINIAHNDVIVRNFPDSDLFLVSIRADRGKFLFPNFEIVQNPKQVKLKKQHYITHWPQPGLIRRKKNRRIRNVVFAGDERQNILTGYPIEEYCKSIDLNYKFFDYNKWNDFSEVDMLIAVRSFDGNRYTFKPPTKLINAWHAEVPIITGPESAYAQIGVKGVDYLVANSFEELKNTIYLLATNENLYANLVSNGKKKIQLFNRASITAEWEKVLKKILKIYKSKEWQRSTNKIVRSILYFYDKKKLK